MRRFRAAALCASSRIARGSAFRNRRMFAACVDRTLSALSEISYYLDMGYAMGLISKEDHQEIESLGGRALFYSMKLVMSLAGGSPDETRSEERRVGKECGYMCERYE